MIENDCSIRMIFSIFFSRFMCKWIKISKNFKIAMNTINQAIDLIQKSGIDVTSETQEADEEYVITLKVKK